MVGQRALASIGLRGDVQSLENEGISNYNSLEARLERGFSDGLTLGGLVEIGRKIDQHLRNAIELGRLCSNDPVCAQHSAKQVLEERFLLGAACHGCLLISETSCERFNQYLDRSLVVATVGGTGAEFFTDQDLKLP